jgi:hypothetical protein
MQASSRYRCLLIAKITRNQGYYIDRNRDLVKVAEYDSLGKSQLMLNF